MFTKPESPPSRLAVLGLPVALSLTLTLAGCGGDGAGSLSKAAVAVGLSDVPPLPAEVVDVACDLSTESPCTATALAATLDGALGYAAARPGSHVRLWRVGGDVSDTSIVAEQVSPGPGTKGRKAAKADRERFVASSHRLFLKAAEPMLAAPPVNRSPLLEAATKIALAEIPGISTRVQVLITDGLDYSRWADWECAPIEPVEALSQRLHAGHVLTPGVLKDTRVYLSYCDPAHVARGRCRSSIARLTEIQDSWRRLLREAGAADVTITTSASTLQDAATGRRGEP